MENKDSKEKKEIKDYLSSSVEKLFDGDDFDSILGNTSYELLDEKEKNKVDEATSRTVLDNFEVEKIRETKNKGGEVTFNQQAKLSIDDIRNGKMKNLFKQYDIADKNKLPDWVIKSVKPTGKEK